MRVLVYGLARSGAAAGAALEARGDEVVRADRSLGNEDDATLLDGVELLVKSPGVPGERALVVEALSVMIQVFSFKRFGRRVFLMAPIHHHFEMKAWSETKIIVRFWILAGIFASSGFVLYYLRFNQFS